jgi:predicted nucleotidyltransferase
MGRADALPTLKQHETELKQLGVHHLYLFGSTARGEAGAASDVDLFFDHERGKLRH